MGNGLWVMGYGLWVMGFVDVLTILNTAILKKSPLRLAIYYNFAV